MKKRVDIVAKDQATALAEAIDFFSNELGEPISKDEIVLKGKKEKSGFLGFGKKVEFSFVLSRKEEETEDSDDELQELANIPDPDLDGYFEIKVRPDGVFIRVVEPQGNGKRVNRMLVKQIIEKKELVDVNNEIVDKALDEATGELVLIADRKPELDRDAELKVNISQDKLEAHCTYIPPLGGKDYNLTTAIEEIKAQGVNYGIDDGKVKALLDEGIKQEMLIATGLPAVDGKPAQLRFHFKLPDEQKYVRELEDGNVDFRNLDLVVNVRQGDLLVTKLPPTAGDLGKAVTGEEIKPKHGQDLKLPKGKNVEIGADDMSLFASIDGQVYFEGDKVNVLPVFTVDGDVDLETGNIQFIGNVIVKGNVREGFSVKAEGNIEIMGNVGAALIEAGGNVIVRKGFQGKQKGLIKANGDVQVGFVENGQIITRGNLTVNGAIMHSQVVAKLDIVVEGRGLIVGGTVQSGNDITAKTIGSHLATPTEVLAGVDPEIRQQLEQINIELENATENFEKVSKGVELLRKTEKQLGGLPKDKRGVKDQFEKTRIHLKGQINQMQQQKEMLTQQLKEMKNGRIQVFDRVYPGVKLSIGQSGYRVKDSLARTAFVYEEGDVRTKPL